MSLEIYFRDLNESGKKKVLEFFKFEREEDANWDVFPLTIIEESEALSEPEIPNRCNNSIGTILFFKLKKNQISDQPHWSITIGTKGFTFQSIEFSIHPYVVIFYQAIPNRKADSIFYLIFFFLVFSSFFLLFSIVLNPDLLLHKTSEHSPIVSVSHFIAPINLLVLN